MAGLAINQSDAGTERIFDEWKGALSCSRVVLTCGRTFPCRQTFRIAGNEELIAKNQTVIIS